jgi:dTDP-4-dehydrorhamnose 3,5-epimerase
MGEAVQANRAERRAGTVVGLHFHRHQTDCWSVPSGRALVVLHDLRIGSPTEGVTEHLEMGASPGEEPDLRSLLIPAGVAHGFAALTDLVVTYLVDRAYDPSDELGIAWDDPMVAADWTVTDPILSGRDRSNPKRAELAADELPRYATRPT